MADRNITVPEPADLNTPGLEIVLRRVQTAAGPRSEIVVSYIAQGLPHSAAVDPATELTAPQRTALLNALAPVLTAAKPKMGF